MPQESNSDSAADFRPTCSLEMLRKRAALIGAVREFFRGRGYLEVETPLLSRDILVDAHLEPLAVPLSGGEMFLQTSPEFAMKRLLAAGAEAIFQITKAFRRGESGRLHNPEFTMLEWYRAGDTHHEQMRFTEELVKAVFQRADRLLGREWKPGSSDNRVSGRPGNQVFGKTWFRDRSLPFERLSYDEAFDKYAGTKVLQLSAEELDALARSRGVVVPTGLAAEDRDGRLNLLLAECVEPHLGVDRPLFLYDYPASQAALARIRRDQPPVAERFELYIRGIEICNGYHELTDPAEFAERTARQAALREREGHRALPRENRLLYAMQFGLPPCAGVALGIDRLVMLALGADSLREVVAFPFARA